MLPNNLWRPWEPRASFPVFADRRNLVDFVIQDSFRADARTWATPAYSVYKRRKSVGAACRDYVNLVLHRPMVFRGALVTRMGEFVRSWKLSGPLQAGDYFSVDLNELMRADGIAPIDGVFILIATRGRVDLWSSSPGSASVRYVGEQSVAGYRTGLFARTINPIDGKKHVGFTGLNPQVMVADGLVASVLLINHSSDPSYDRTASPTIRLYRTPTEYQEARFGDIAPHGALERSVPDLFPRAGEFLAAHHGYGYTVAQGPGVSLASIHIIRSRDDRSLALEHSRPAHTNVVDYF